MEKPKLYTIIWRDKKQNSKFFYTNDEETAERKAAINDGEIYIDTRYKAKVRLYNHINRIR